MTGPPLFSSLIVSRRSPAWSSFRRAAGIAAAASAHFLALVLLALAPMLWLEMLEPPKALVPSIQIYQPPLGPGHGGHRLPAPSIRKGGGAAAGMARVISRTPAPRPPATIRPDRIPPPLPASEPRADLPAPADRAAAPIPGAPAGPGDPNGHGTSPDGLPEGGCEGCTGQGSGDGAEAPGNEGPVGEFDPGVVSPVLIAATRALPKYPDPARRASIQGTVILMIVIRADGTVGEVEVVRSPDQRFGFDLAAIEAVKRWRYQPALMHGRPVAVYAQVMVEFTLAR